MNSHYFVFDVEAIGLHGEGFAVAYVVVNADGDELEFAQFACSSASAAGTDADRAWVAQNVPSLPISHVDLAEMRAAFWQAWLRWRSVGASENKIFMVADCAWPVEARFLNACVNDVDAAAYWQGPYPLLDVSTLQHASNMNLPVRDLVTHPLHNPLADARYSAAVWLALMLSARC